jgi:hypothetical protein
MRTPGPPVRRQLTVDPGRPLVEPPPVLYRSFEKEGNATLAHFSPAASLA